MFQKIKGALSASTISTAARSPRAAQKKSTRNRRAERNFKNRARFRPRGNIDFIASLLMFFALAALTLSVAFVADILIDFGAFAFAGIVPLGMSRATFAAAKKRGDVFKSITGCITFVREGGLIYPAGSPARMSVSNLTPGVGYTAAEIMGYAPTREAQDARIARIREAQPARIARIFQNLDCVKNRGFIGVAVAALAALAAGFGIDAAAALAAAVPLGVSRSTYARAKKRGDVIEAQSGLTCVLSRGLVYVSGPPEKMEEYGIAPGVGYHPDNFRIDTPRSKARVGRALLLCWNNYPPASYFRRLARSRRGWEALLPLGIVDGEGGAVYASSEDLCCHCVYDKSGMGRKGGGFICFDCLRECNADYPTGLHSIARIERGLGSARGGFMSSAAAAACAAIAVVVGVIAAAGSGFDAATALLAAAPLAAAVRAKKPASSPRRVHPAAARLLCDGWRPAVCYFGNARPVFFRTEAATRADTILRWKNPSAATLITAFVFERFAYPRGVVCRDVVTGKSLTAVDVTARVMIMALASRPLKINPPFILDDGFGPDSVAALRYFWSLFGERRAILSAADRVCCSGDFAGGLAGDKSHSADFVSPTTA